MATNGISGHNLYSSGYLTGTSATVSGLPTSGVTVYARLWSEVNGSWLYNDYSYSADGTLARAELTSPAPGSKLPGASATFSWTAGSGVTRYQLHVATDGISGHNLYSSGYLTGTSATVSGLPTSGVTVYARLWSEVNGVWLYNDYS